MPALATAARSKPIPPYRVVVFPSGDPELEFVALVPAALSVSDVKRLTRAAIKAANDEDARMCDDDDDGCFDGYCVEDSIKHRLEEHGFVFPDETTGGLVKTALWDQVMD